MTDPSLTTTARSVLIVNESEDSREVFRRILQSRGVQIFEAEKGSDGLALARQHHPQVIVLDVDEASPDRELCGEFAEQADHDRTSLVLLGSVRGLRSAKPGEFVAKPYQYRPLIRKIEELLAESTHEADMPSCKKAA